MAYTKQTWQDLPSKTTPINASRLGHIEQGIYDAASTADTAASNASSALSGLDDKVDKITGKGLSTNDFTDALQTKLNNIAEGAEVNVQSDWNQSDNSADDYIKNKPTLGTASAKNSTSVVTSSSDLVESGAVKDIVGWGNENYFTAEGITTGYYLTQNGTTIEAANWRTTDYIDISDLSNIELKGIGANGNTPSLCFYDSNKVYISGVQYKNRTDIITVKPSNAVYIRVSVFVDDMETIILTHASVDETKADNSVIGTVEDGIKPTKAYAVNEFMVRDGAFCQVTAPVTTSSTWTEGSNYTKKSIAEVLQSLMS